MFRDYSLKNFIKMPNDILVQELKESITDVWVQISQYVIKMLDTIHNRIFTTIHANRGSTKY